MNDQNNVRIKTGDVVEITGAYFKNDNGLYFVQYAPGDPGWLGNYCSLRRVRKSGEISAAKYSLCSWPISTYVNDREKRAAADCWNLEHAKIEVKPIANRAHIAAHFAQEADSMSGQISYQEFNFGPDDPCVVELRTRQNFLYDLAASIQAAQAQ